MTTKTILKHGLIYIYEDYKDGRAARRINELTDIGQAIYRSPFGTMKAILLKKSWWDARVAAYTAVKAPLLSLVGEVRDDDYMGKNLSFMVDLIRGNPQVISREKVIISEGTTAKGIKTYFLTKTKKYYIDPNPLILEDSTRRGGDISAVLTHPGLYNFLNTAPVATVYVGAGNGIIGGVMGTPGGTITEVFTILAINPTTFSVTGTVSGFIGNATVGTQFVSPQILFLITAGGVPFVAGDKFTVTTKVFQF